MAGNPLQDVLQMLMAQGGAMPPGGGNIPMMPQQGPQNAMIAALSPQAQGVGGRPVTTPDLSGVEDEEELVDTSREMMGLPRQFQMPDSFNRPPTPNAPSDDDEEDNLGSPMPPGMMPPGMPASASDISESERMESFDDPKGERSEYDPNFPEDDPDAEPDDDEDDAARTQTEGELADVRAAMAGADDDGDWESTGPTPTASDLEAFRENPTDGMIRDFAERFPKYIAELILTEGGNPGKSPDQYAMSDEEYDETQRDRSTSIDER